ncbi:peptide deformylase [Sphingomonas abietis]|uniref:Peptide deformylase n=1 Tax=Sphingomonas abietis TaxID=3012344 RepID=A0ABY7NQU8_9SPHN|nr:peptide deformylase [Sphingomonas abietis]WBO23763.1 peptide deformylase [Sphingomonas abietis]
MRRRTEARGQTQHDLRHPQNGDPRLLEVARPIEDPADPDLKSIIANLYETMHATNGVGLAAPQVGINLRLLIFGFDSNPRYPDEAPVPVTTLINPWMEMLSEDMEDGWEGCLSVPGMRGLVPRATHIRYGGMLEDGVTFEREARGFHARVFQHEFDHLNGILYPLRIRDLTQFGFIEALFPESGLAALESTERA